MAADAYARIKGKPCLVNVTAGPGAINALNGAGAYVDSLPRLFLAANQSVKH